MFIIDKLGESELWALGDFAGKNRVKLAVARADMRRDSVLELRLRLEATPGDHPLHINVADWPTEKDAQKALALEFCAVSTLAIRP